MQVTLGLQGQANVNEIPVDLQWQSTLAGSTGIQRIRLLPTRV